MPLPEGKTPAERAEIKDWLKGRNKFPSGFCNEYNKPGQHEGTKPRGGKGVPLPTCHLWTSCPCRCHYDIDKLFKLAGIERTEEQPNPEYKVPVSTFILPSDPIPHDMEALSNGDGVNGHPIPEGTATPMPRAALVASLPPTPTGRRHRGQLEYEVLTICERWCADDTQGPELCTPKWVAETIAEELKIPTPSTGAVQAVWDRWEKLGIATQAKKPARFTGWTGDFDGTATSLDRIKARKKRELKSAKSAQARGFR